ncbi:MAG: hypothetical protein AABZ58_07685 [Chloroflexota bacterium]
MSPTVGCRTMAVTPNPARLAAAVAAVRWNDLLGGLVPEILHQLHFVVVSL